MSKIEEMSVVIVGCGISGFTCATKLIEFGFKNVKILEAEDRIGGRIFTTEFAGGLIDLGAQWCHGVDGNVVHELAGEDSFAETKMDFSKMTFTRSDGSEVDKESCRRLMELCDGILERLKDETSGTVDEILTKKFNEALETEEFQAIDRVLAQEVLDNFKKRESSYCGCENLSKLEVGGFSKFRDCNGPTWLNWKGKGYKPVFDLVLVSWRYQVVQLNSNFFDLLENIKRIEGGN
jgi:spermine oxidase